MIRRLGFIITAFMVIMMSFQGASASTGAAPTTVVLNGQPATTITSYNLTCSGLTVTGKSGAPFVSIFYSPNDNSIPFPVSNGTFSVTLSFPALATGTPVEFQAYGVTAPNGNNSDGHDWQEVDYQSCPASWSSSAGGVTFFNPGDNRVDPRPGDRIAVWCNTTATPPAIVVYGVGDASNNSGGFYLATFKNADLLKAGKAGITKNGGQGNGAVSAMQDGSGNFYVAWNGGIFNATGTGVFAKSFSCDFK